jgi:hypothetical protein
VPSTVLIIDGRGRPEGLVRAFESAGWSCFYARGPLRVRAILSSEACTAIVWRDTAGNSELGQDLAKAWACLPQAFVVHLAGEPLRRTEVSGATQIRLRLPLETPEAQVVAALEGLLHPANPASRSELRVLAASRDPSPHPNPSAAEGLLSPSLVDTGVGALERATLSGKIRDTSATLWQRVRMRIGSTGGP